MKTIIPELPEPFVISEEIQMKLEAWVEYFKNLSPRVRIKRPSDDNFDLKGFEVIAKDLTESSDDFTKIKLHDWPKLEQVAFVVSYDSSLPGHIKEFLGKNIYIFCYGDFAFSLKHFECVEEIERYDIYQFDLQTYPEEALCWNYMAKIIREGIMSLQEKIKSPKPPPPEEKLFDDKIERCSDCKWRYWPNNHLNSATDPACQGNGGHRALTKENYFEKKPDDCPLKGKDERY